MAHRELAGGVHLIDDTYNANPGSMAAAIQTLADLGRNSRRLLVMGDMLELGDQSAALHAAAGELAARSGVSALLVAGRFGAAVTRGARAGGLQDERIFAGSREEILAALKKRLRPGDWVLVKGSRGMGMETIVQGLAAWTGP
jgi:UDP-N-acetylmuramoyl-tripeptide--D-alanyl-D-alanine ligase